MVLLLLLVPIALALVVVSVLGFAGFGPLTDDRRADRDGALGVVGPAVGLLLGFVLLAFTVLATFVVGFGGAGDGDGDGADDDPRVTAPLATAPPATTPPATAPATTGAAAAPSARSSAARTTLGAHVTIEADDGDGFPDSYDVADRLAPNTVLQVTARGFELFAEASAAQCAPTVTTSCFNEIPVQFDAHGEARFQYLVSTDFVTGAAPPGRCRADAAPCTIVVRAGHPKELGEIQTIFRDAIAPPGFITVTPVNELALAGETVTVDVERYPPGARVFATLCAAPAAVGAQCGAPGPQAPMIIGPDGRGHAELWIEPGPVGTSTISCGRGDACGISVASDEVFVRAPVVPITFAPPPGADYDPTRLALALALAAILLAIAAWLIFRTDWSAVGEVAAPEIDDADYADLDAIIAALPPEEDELVGAR